MPLFPFVNGEEAKTAATTLLSLARRSASPSSEANALRELKGALAGVPHHEKTALVHVQRVRPELVDDDHMLGFLRGEGLDVKLALKKLLQYWELRHKAFGDNYALPMTLNGAMKDCVHAVMQGYMVLMPVLDGAGRAIFYFNSRNFRNEESSETTPIAERIKLFWYLQHVLMENPSVVQNGFVILANARHSRLIDFNTKSMVAIHKASDVFPLRWGMTQVCHADSIFPRVAAAIKAAFPVHLRKTFKLHSGSDEEVLKELCRDMLTKDCIPKELGGNVCIQSVTKAFVQQRLAVEGGTLDSNQDGKKSSLSERLDAMHACAAQLAANKVESAKLISAVSVQPPNALVVKSMPEPEGITLKTAGKKRPLPVGSNDSDRKRKTPNNSRGCKGDPRMSRAIQAKMDDPSLTLADALVAGGYEFPTLYAPNVKIGDVKDTENVSLVQRRNQMIRRMRNARKKEAGEK